MFEGKKYAKKELVIKESERCMNDYVRRGKHRRQMEMDANTLGLVVNTSSYQNTDGCTCVIESLDYGWDSKTT